MTACTRRAAGHLTAPSRTRRLWWYFLLIIYPITLATWALVELCTRTVDALFTAAHGWDTPKTPGGVVRGALATYDGPDLTLRDGTLVRKGDPIFGIHFESFRIWLLHLTGKSATAGGMRDYRALAAWLAADRTAVAVRCETILPSKDLASMGFEVRPFREHSTCYAHRWFFQLFAEGYVLLCHAKGFRYFASEYSEIKDGWMSPAEFVRRYGAHRRSNGRPR